MIENYLNTDTFTTRKELVAKTGMKDRVIRDKISNLKLKKPIIYNSQTKGYRLTKKLSTLNREQLIEEILEVQHSRNDIVSRIEVFSKQLKVYDDYLHEADRFLLRRTSEELYGTNKEMAKWWLTYI